MAQKSWELSSNESKRNPKFGDAFSLNNRDFQNARSLKGERKRGNKTIVDVKRHFKSQSEKSLMRFSSSTKGNECQAFCKHPKVQMCTLTFTDISPGAEFRQFRGDIEPDAFWVANLRPGPRPHLETSPSLFRKTRVASKGNFPFRNSNEMEN